MHILPPLIILALIFCLSEQTSIPQFGEIAFLKDRIFFLSESKREFGFIDASTGHLIMKESFQDKDSVIGFDKKDGWLAVRNDRQKLLLFQLEKLNIREVDVHISFNHQRIVDFLLKGGQFYILTNKDLRQYDQNTQTFLEDGKNILSSCSKQEWFLKVFEKGEGFQILLIKDQQICIRSIKEGKKDGDVCLLTIESKIEDIKKVGTRLFLKIARSYYLIEEDLSYFKIEDKGFKQIGERFAPLSGKFSSFDFQQRREVPGFSIIGSTSQHDFWLKETNHGKIDVLYNNKVVSSIDGQEKPVRAWVGPGHSRDFVLLLQYSDNRVQFIDLKDDESSEL